MNEPHTQGKATALILHSALFAVLWWALTEGASDSWTIGVPAVLLAAVSGMLLLPTQRIEWLELLRFLPFFLLRSILGGVDVARRAIQPTMPIAPALIDYPMSLPSGLAQAIMINTISLLPGTLSADISGDRVRLHVLDARVDYLTEIEAVERHVARLFGIPLSSNVSK